MFHRVTRFLVPSILLLALSACVSTQTVPLAKSVASKGQAVATAALAVYDDVDAALDREKMQHDRTTFLGRPKGSQLPLPDGPRKDLSPQLQPRRKAFRAVKRAYAQLQELADLNAPADISGAATGLATAINNLATTPDGDMPISSTTKNLLGAVVSQITAAQQQKHIRRHNVALLSTTNALRELWSDDAKTIGRLLTGITSDYVSTIRGLPADRFDEVKLRTVIDEPFDAAYAAGMYKFEVIDQIVQKQRDVETSVANVSRSMDALVAAHTALDADRPSIQDVLTATTAITDALKEEE